MIAILLNLLFLGAFVWIAYLGIEMLRGIPAQGKQVLYIIVAIFAVLYFCNVVGWANTGFPVYRVTN